MAQILSNAQNPQIDNAAFNIQTNNYGMGPSLRGLDLLRHHVAPAALVDAREQVDPPRCDANTRLAIIEDIMQWITGGEGGEASMLWMHGAAGAGKTALGRMIAERCMEEKRLIATFFFSRTMPGRSDGSKLIATLASQLAPALSVTKGIMDARIRDNPGMFDLNMERQMEELLYKPLNKFYQVVYYRCRDILKRRQPRLILIDGLDECFGTDVQCEIIRVMAKLVGRCRLPIRIFIASRPESYITRTFDDETFEAISVKRVDLSADPNAEGDIRNFLTLQFSKIRRMHPDAVSGSWPASADVERLVEKSSGQFIYASVAVNFIKVEHYGPDERLQVLLGLTAEPTEEQPFAQLDELYRHILTSVHNFQSTMQIVALLALPRTSHEDYDDYATPAMLEQLLSLPPGAVRRYLSGVLSLFSLQSYKEPIKAHHASLPDFLFDASRSKECFIDQETALKTLAQGYLHCFSNINTKELRDAACIDSPITAFILPSLAYCRIAGLSEQWLKTMADIQFIDIITDSYRSLLDRSPWKVHSVETKMERFFSSLSQLDLETSKSAQACCSDSFGTIWNQFSFTGAVEKVRHLNKNDVVVIVVGSGGSGKSTLLNVALGQSVFKVSQTLDPSTETGTFESMRVILPGSARSFVLVDAPASDRLGRRRDTIILDWLRKVYPGPHGQIDIGFLLLYPITRSVRWTKELSDLKGLFNIVIETTKQSGRKSEPFLFVTTMWDRIRVSEMGEAREEELGSWIKRWGINCAIVRHDGSSRSAWRVLGTLLAEMEVDF